MLFKRSRKMFGGVALEYFAILDRGDAEVAAIRAGKLDGNRAVRTACAEVIDRYLKRFFSGFWVASAVPGGQSGQWVAEWVARHPHRIDCFGSVSARGHHFSRRLRNDFDIPIVGDVKGKLIVVVDDVVTTGATMYRHLYALGRAGAVPTGLALVSG